MYDAFNNITSRNTKAWNFNERNHPASFTNNRKSSGGYQSSVDSFDVAGNITQNQIFSGSTTDIRKWKFDAAGRMVDWEETLPEAGVYLRDTGAELVYDGDGRISKRINRHRVRGGNNPNPDFVIEPEYALFSSVTGQKITTLNQTGGKYQNFVYQGSSVIAQQTWGGNDNNEVVFKQTDPITASEMQTKSDGEISPNGQGRNDIGAMGVSVPSQEPEEFPTPNYKQGGSVSNPEFGCMVDWMLVNCSDASMALENGVGVIGPLKQVESVIYRGKKQNAFYRAFADGYSGYVPQMARYIGNGAISPRLTKPTLKNRPGGRSVEFPDDTDLAKLNGATGALINEGVQVLKYTGEDAFWKSRTGDKKAEDDLVDFWRSLLAEALARPECQDFINKYIGGDNLLRTFDLVRIQGGFSFTETGFGGLAGSSVNENFGGRIRFNNNQQWDYNNLQASFENTQSMLATLIHELIHVTFNGAGDVAMQDKLYAAGEHQTSPRSANAALASINWDSILALQKHCGITFKEFSNWWRQQ